MDASKFCYSGVLNQASTDEPNKALIKLFTDKDPVKSVKSQTQDLQLNSVVHPMAYISDSFTESQLQMFWCFYVDQKMFLIFIKFRLISTFGP